MSTTMMKTMTSNTAKMTDDLTPDEPESEEEFQIFSAQECLESARLFLQQQINHLHPEQKNEYYAGLDQLILALESKNA